jgi:mannose-6-phosphate isomerase-like protein (cupin superfamily)
MGLVELGQHTGLSAALLSKIERGRLFPTLPTLLRIALVFSVGLDFFFAGSRDKPVRAVVRKSERVRLPERPEGRDVAYRFESLDFPATERRFNSYYAEFLPVAREALRLHDHPGVEFLYVLQGTLSLHTGDEEYALAAGDAMYFDAAVPHGYRRTGKGASSALVVTAS